MQVIYVDGSGIENSGLLKSFGWGLVYPNKDIELSGKIYEENSSVTRAELIAAIEALRLIATLEKGHYVIYSDNITVTDGFDGTCSRKSHKDLWEQVYKLVKTIRKKGSTFEVQRYERDSTKEDFKYAQRVDKLAYTAANRLF